MEKHIFDEQNGLNYTLTGDYYLHDLAAPQPEPLGKWGRLYKGYLKNNKPHLYNGLLLSDKLQAYLKEADEQSTEKFEILIAQMKAAEGVTEELKAIDQMAWVRAMNSISSRAEEIVWNELIDSCSVAE